MIKVIIADDQELIRQSLQIILRAEKDIDVIDTVANGVEVIRCLLYTSPSPRDA